MCVAFSDACSLQLNTLVMRIADGFYTLISILKDAVFWWLVANGIEFIYLYNLLENLFKA